MSQHCRGTAAKRVTLEGTASSQREALTESSGSSGHDEAGFLRYT